MPISPSDHALGDLVLPGLIAPNRPRWLDLIAHGFAMLGYWAMIAPAGYRALWQLIHPTFQEKTRRAASQSLDGSVAPTRGAWP